MEAVYLVFGILLALTGFFLAIALSIQLCACCSAFQRIQREKARQREIRLAAAEGPPPYAMAVLSCRRSQASSLPCHHSCQQARQGGGSPPNAGSRSSCSHLPSLSILPPTHSSCASDSSLSQGNSGVSADQSIELDCSCSSYQMKDNDEPLATISTELPPSYEEALRRESIIAGGVDNVNYV